MTEIFPQLAGVRIDYVWGGMVGFSWDRVPHAGEVNGLYYSMGYCGHGVQMATYMGRAVAEMMDGNPEANPMRGFGFPKVPVPFYNGTALVPALRRRLLQGEGPPALSRRRTGDTAGAFRAAARKAPAVPPERRPVHS